MKVIGTTANLLPSTIKFNGGLGSLNPGDVIAFTDAMGVEHTRVVKRVESSNTIWVEGNKLAEAADLLRNTFYDAFDIVYKEEKVVRNERGTVENGNFG